MISHNFSAFSKSVFAVVAWHIWKARCDSIFRATSINIRLISIRAFQFAKSNFHIGYNMIGKKLLLNNFTSTDGLFLFSEAHWNEDNKVGFIAYFISNSNYKIILAGCRPVECSSKLEAEVLALICALGLCVHHQFLVQHVFISCSNLKCLQNNANSWCGWQHRRWINTLFYMLVAS